MVQVNGVRAWVQVNGIDIDIDIDIGIRIGNDIGIGIDIGIDIDIGVDIEIAIDIDICMILASSEWCKCMVQVNDISAWCK